MTQDQTIDQEILPKEVQQVNAEEDPREYEIIGWIDKHQLKNEKGDLLTLEDHLFQVDIYQDQSQNLVVMKAAQVGMSTVEINKNIYDARRYGMDIIYTLPTDNDVSVFVGGKVNRIIANNEVLKEYTADKDSIEQKQIGKGMLYFRGTWTKKAAIMVTADRLVHDEKDSSKQEVVSDYQARLQHSKFKQTHVFSHPSVPGNGVHVEWQKSDQKEWFIECPHCAKKQYLSWNIDNPKKMSIDLKRRIFVCKGCRGELNQWDRALGQWIPKYRDTLPNGQKIDWSGYHISLLMMSNVTAGEIIDKFKDSRQAPEYFDNKVLGLPHTGSGNVVTYETIRSIITPEANLYNTRMVVGVDTGLALRWVQGNKQGIMGFGEMTDYMPDEINKLRLDQTLEYFLKTWPQCIMVIDQGGDIIGPRKLRAKYPGRVFLCHYARDRKTMQMIRWGEGDESGNVNVDRNRWMQYVIDEMREKRFMLYGHAEEEWYDYWLHWSHIYRTREEDELGVLQTVWHRNNRDDWVHATLYWRAGIDRFGDTGFVSTGEAAKLKPNSYMIDPDGTVSFDPEKLLKEGVSDDYLDTIDGEW